jgi:RIO kinase 1
MSELAATKPRVKKVAAPVLTAEQQLEQQQAEEDADDSYFADLEADLMGEERGGISGGRSKGAVGGDFTDKINLTVRVQNDINKSERKGDKKSSHYGRDDRATSEQVMDPRTRLILFKLLNSGYLTEIDGCLSTGKEANVYYATGRDDKEYAVKIFKTSILVFKDRDRYVSGEHRFRHGYCKSNPRKMVKTWAEKEMRNLKRLDTAGIPCPVPWLLKSHVLVMDFLGSDGWCAPRLKDATLTQDQYQDCYQTVCLDMHRMYYDCNLVHGDLSEYNLLWHNDRAVIIDVSQSVEHGHPYANDFLRKDIFNITDYFRKMGATVLSNFSLFQFITTIGNGRANVSDEISSEALLEAAFERAMEAADEAEEEDDGVLPESLFARGDTSGIGLEQNSVAHLAEKAKIDEAVFLQSYIPTSLHEFGNPHKELSRLQAGQRETIYEDAVNKMLGLAVGEESTTEHKIKPAPKIVCLGGEGQADEEGEGNASGQEDGDENSGDSDSDSDGSDTTVWYDSDAEDTKYHRRLPNRDGKPEKFALKKQEKKEMKKLAKADATEKRTKKIPKHIKKRAIKSGKKK